MPVVERSIEINSPVETVFAIHDDPKRVVEYMPGIVRMSDIVQTQRRTGDSARFTYSLLGIRFPTKHTVLEWEQHKRIVVRLDGALRGTFTATYEPLGSNTRVTWRIDYTMAGRILQKVASLPLAERMSEKNVEQGLENLKMICEAS